MSDTEQNLIDAAQELMLRQGYAGTGINDICRHAGVSKGAFYHSFDSKEDLTLRTLDNFYEIGLRELGGVDVSDIDPEDRVIVFVERVAEIAPYLWENGCLIGGLASEMATTSDPLQERVSNHFDRFAEVVEAVAEPYVDSLKEPYLSAADIAEEFLAVVEGAIVLARAHRDPTRIRSALERLALHLRHLPKA